MLDTPVNEAHYVAYAHRNASRMKFKILVNNKDHDWRPPCKAINAGLFASSGTFCVVQSPETILLTPCAGHLMKYDTLPIPGRFMVTGIVRFFGRTGLPSGDFCRDWYDSFTTAQFLDSYGFLMARREDFISIGGYDERRKNYGGDDTCIRNRMLRSGCSWIKDHQIRLAHIGAFAPRGVELMEPLTDDIVVPTDFQNSEFSMVYDWMKEPRMETT